MDRKIKSVKLLNDYRDRTHYILAGTKLTNTNTSYWWLANIMSIHEDEIREDKTNLFDVEYESEPETKKITVQIEYNHYKGDTYLTADNVLHCIQSYSGLTAKVTEIK